MIDKSDHFPIELYFNLIKMNYKLTISYDGTNYSGWQIQPDSKTIQEIIEKV